MLKKYKTIIESLCGDLVTMNQSDRKISKVEEILD